MKISKEKQQQLVFVGIITVVLVVAMWFVLISPTGSKMGLLATKSKELEKKLADQEATIKTKSVTAGRLEGYSVELKKMEEGMVPLGDAYSGFLRSFNSFKRPYVGQTDIKSVDKENVYDVGLYPTPPFPYRIAGFQGRGIAHFHDFGRFLMDWENKNPYGRIQKIYIRPAGQQEADVPEKLSFDLEFVTFISTNAP
jgi:hypothetical protein